MILVENPPLTAGSAWDAPPSFIQFVVHLIRRTHCWFILNPTSTGTLRSTSVRLLFSQSLHSSYKPMRLCPHTENSTHLLSTSSIFLLTHSSSISRPLLTQVLLLRYIAPDHQTIVIFLPQLTYAWTGTFLDSTDTLLLFRNHIEVQTFCFHLSILGSWQEITP